jgi:hypothetical protein
MGVTPGVVELHIDEVVLEGVDPSSRHAVGEALRTELVRLLTGQPPSFEQHTAITALNAGALSVGMNATPHTLGSAIAQSVHQGVSR